MDCIIFSDSRRKLIAWTSTTTSFFFSPGGGGQREYNIEGGYKYARE